jgi:hypothetical protein
VKQQVKLSYMVNYSRPDFRVADDFRCGVVGLSTGGGPLGGDDGSPRVRTGQC